MGKKHWATLEGRCYSAGRDSLSRNCSFQQAMDRESTTNWPNFFLARSKRDKEKQSVSETPHSKKLEWMVFGSNQISRLCSATMSENRR